MYKFSVVHCPRNSYRFIKEMMLMIVVITDESSSFRANQQFFNLYSKVELSHSLKEKVYWIIVNMDTEKIITAITSALEKAYSEKDKIIMCNKTKALDTISHGILIQKLTEYGVRGKSNEIKSYLNNGHQLVECKRIKSEERHSNCGVTQGSILGIVLFIIYLNDFFYNMKVTVLGINNQSKRKKRNATKRKRCLRRSPKTV